MISVIIPVYKVEPYLDRCVESVINQSYPNLEIILVDDGSPDNCPAMCDAWAERDSRIKVIHKTNGGLSDARNAGMEKASGEYIAFVDSDDWIHCKCLELLFDAIQQTGAQLAACDVIETDKDRTIDPPVAAPSVRINSREEAMISLSRGERFRAVAWNKLYKKELLLNESFPVGKLHEDEFFTYRIIDKCSILAYVDFPLYYYFQREGSIMSGNSARHIDALEAYIGRQSLFREKYPALYLNDKLMFCTACIILYSNLPKERSPETETAKARIKNYRSLVHFSAKELRGRSVKQLMSITGSSPALIRLFSGIWNLKHKERT